MQNTTKSISWHDWYIIPAIVLSLLMRIVLPWGNVFHNGIVRFNTVDAYYFIDAARAGSTTNDVWINTIRIFGNNDIAIAWIPIVLYIIILVLAYLLIDILFDNKVISGLTIMLIAVMPGEFFNRTSLGAADRHCLEILLFTMCILCFTASIKFKEIETRIVAGIGFIGYATIYSIAWPNGWIILLVVLYCGSVLMAIAHYYRAKSTIIISAIAIVAAALIIIATGNLDKFIYNFSWQLGTDVKEEMPLFFYMGTLDMTTMLQNYSVLFFLGLVGLGILSYDWYKSRDPAKGILLAWSIIMLILTLAQRRWAYYSEINIAILTIYAGWFFVTRFSVRKLPIILMLMIAYIPAAEQCVMMGISPGGYIPDTTYSALQEIKKDPGLVLAWWDQGYWIRYFAGADPYTTPGNNPADPKRIVTDQLYGLWDPDAAANFISGTIGAKYILVNEIEYKGLNKPAGSFLNQLWNNRIPLYQLVHSTNGTKLFKVVD